MAWVATGLGYVLRVGTPRPQLSRLLGAALAQLPASLVVAAVAVLAFGLAPRAAVPGRVDRPGPGGDDRAVRPGATGAALGLRCRDIGP